MGPLLSPAPDAEPLLLETDVAVDYLRGQADAVAYVNGLTGAVMLSAMTVAELYAGVRDGDERTALAAFVSAFQIIAVDSGVAAQSGLYRRDYGKSHGTGLADALIAATAQAAGATLATLNTRHFPMLPKVIVPYRKP